MHSAGWQSSVGRDLNGLTLGLIGLGKIGQQMATIARVFGMDVGAWSPNLNQQRCDEAGVHYHASLGSLMSASDVVSVHMVLSDATHHLIDAAAFATMRERAIFINTSRGPIADEQALLEGLLKGKPWKAGLDVYSEEPLPASSPMREQSLVNSGRLLLSPHLGYVTEQTWSVFYTQTVEAVIAWQKGEPIRVIS